jgi:diaminopimelate epimerase
MKFTKMHGCGNDYIYINGFEEKVPDSKKSVLVRKLSDRHCGIGSDGVIFINPCENADFEMEMYNADGSRGEMCGNGIRCMAKYVYEKGMTDKTELMIKSCDRFVTLSLDVERIQNENWVKEVCVNMGSPILSPEKIPVAGCENRDCAIREPIIVAGKTFEMTCVSMGNPHAVVFVEGLKDFPVARVGPWFETHPRFPKRTNVEFVEVLDRSTINMRVWERGTGETLACGTGACASVAACVLNRLTDSKVAVKLLGGQLEVFWDRCENVIYMEGPAVTVFEGEWTW